MRPRRALSLATMLGVASVLASKECVVCGLIMALVEEHRHLSRILCPDTHEPACADATGRLLDLVRGGANPDKVCALLGVCEPKCALFTDGWPVTPPPQPPAEPPNTRRALFAAARLSGSDVRILRAGFTSLRSKGSDFYAAASTFASAVAAAAGLGRRAAASAALAAGAAVAPRLLPVSILRRSWRTSGSEMTP